MSDPEAKKQLKKKMTLNPKLKNILEWKGGLAPTLPNIENAIKAENLDIVKYFISRRVDPDLFVMLSIEFGKLDILESLAKDI